MKKVIAVKIVSDSNGLNTKWLDDAKTIVVRTLYVMYSDHAWEEYELHYKGTGEYRTAYPKPFRPQNITDKKMTKDEVNKYIEEFRKSEGL